MCVCVCVCLCVCVYTCSHTHFSLKLISQSSINPQILMGPSEKNHSFLRLQLGIPLKKEYVLRDFPGGAVVKHPPANAGHTGSIPGPGGSHMPWNNWVHAPQLLSLCSRAHEPQLLSARATTTEAHVPRAHAPQQEKPPQ